MINHCKLSKHWIPSIALYRETQNSDKTQYEKHKKKHMAQLNLWSFVYIQLKAITMCMHIWIAWNLWTKTWLVAALWRTILQILAIPCRGNFVVCRCHAISYPSRGSYTLHIFCTVSDNHIHRQNDVSFASGERTNLTNVVLNIKVIAARIWERLKHSVSTDWVKLVRDCLSA